ncbi:hypothetical protein [Pedobacter alpinus]|uniref:DUF5017 domain-containing protein n=1 Tax=Pedobacter alpinus TaxID=1590643 RepID=A0ABW5TMI8_9SPHI
MKNKNIWFLCCLVAGLFTLASCKKESQNIFNMFTDVTVTYNGTHPFSVTDYKLVNDGDSVYIDYTVNSAEEDMYFITVEKVGGASGNSPERTVTPITNEAERRSYSRVLKFRMQRDGKTTYRVFASNSKNVFIGDGYKSVTIEGRPSYTFLANRFVYAPDTLEKIRPSFYSIAQGTTFSYTNGFSNSAAIDFGIWRRQDVPPRQNMFVYNLYALDRTPNPLTVYDVSTWTKRATRFSTIRSGGTNIFLYTLTSSSIIESNARSANPNLTGTASTTSPAALSAGNIVYFVTPEGKYGCILVNAVAKDYEGRDYLSISVKVQR